MKKRFIVLCISVVYRGCSIAVAWNIVEAEEKGSWQPHWMGLLRYIHEVVPHYTADFERVWRSLFPSVSELRAA